MKTSAMRFYLLFTLSFGLISCGGGGGGGNNSTDVLPAQVINVAPPQILSFKITPQTIKEGEVALLEWETGDATSIRIDNGVGGVLEKSSKEVTPQRDTQYTITANNSGGESATASVSIIVRNKLSIPDEVTDQNLRECLQAQIDLHYWENLEDVTYIECVTPNSLRIYDGRVSSLDGLQLFPKLKFINIAGGIYLPSKRINSLEPLRHLEELEIVYLGDQVVNDLSPLANKVGLKELILRGGASKDVSPLGTLVNLEYLDFSGAMFQDNSADDWSPLSNLSNLKTLILAPREMNGNLDYLNGMTNLEYFELWDTYLENYQGLGALKNLKTLILYNAYITLFNETDNRQFISSLTTLESLHIPGATIENYVDGNDQTTYDFLRPLLNLKYLSLAGSGSHIDNAEALFSLTSLEYLNLNETRINFRQDGTEQPTWDGLRSLTELKFLDIRGVTEDKYDFMDSLTQLEEVWDDNKFTTGPISNQDYNLMKIASLPSLKKVFLEFYEEEALLHFSNSANLEEVVTWYVSITDFSIFDQLPQVSTFDLNVGYGEFFCEDLENFNEQHPDVTLTIKDIPSGDNPICYSKN